MRNDSWRQDLQVLENKRVFFGHQSVGRDTLQGVVELTGTAPAFLLESPIGHNGEPASKCADFAREIGRLPSPPDLALMKFCYADFDGGTQPEAVLALYERTVEEVKAQVPGVAIVHVTVPLKASGNALKRLLKQWMQRPDPAGLANLRRSEFNDLLKRRYAREPFFDLAAAESTFPDGRRSTMQVNGRQVHSLVSEYTTDGGHLNAQGRRAAAAAMLRSLAAAASGRPTYR